MSQRSRSPQQSCCGKSEPKAGLVQISHLVHDTKCMKKDLYLKRHQDIDIVKSFQYLLPPGQKNRVSITIEKTSLALKKKKILYNLIENLNAEQMLSKCCNLFIFSSVEEPVISTLQYCLSIALFNKHFSVIASSSVIQPLIHYLQCTIPENTKMWKAETSPQSFLT